MATACAKLEHAFHSAIETYYRVKRGVTQIVRKNQGGRYALMTTGTGQHYAAIIEP
jgi:hypothetical protein